MSSAPELHGSDISLLRMLLDERRRQIKLLEAEAAALLNEICEIRRQAYQQHKDGGAAAMTCVLQIPRNDNNHRRQR